MELSFDWVEQNLRIEAFYGATENAAKARIGVAISVRVSAATVGKELKLERSRIGIVQMPIPTPFEKTPLIRALSGEKSRNDNQLRHGQPSPFDLQPDSAVRISQCRLLRRRTQCQSTR